MGVIPHYFYMGILLRYFYMGFCKSLFMPQKRLENTVRALLFVKAGIANDSPLVCEISVL